MNGDHEDCIRQALVATFSLCHDVVTNSFSAGRRPIARPVWTCERTSPLATPANESMTQPADPAVPAHAGPWSDDRSDRHTPSPMASIATSGTRAGPRHPFGRLAANRLYGVSSRP